jgi:calpain-15
MEIWVILMEKAWAKIHGSYEIIIAGDGATTLRDITGAPSFNYDT